MKKRICIFLLISIACHFAIAQRTFTGQVTHNQKPLEGVIVQLLNTDKTSLLDFAITDAKGEYKIVSNKSTPKSFLDFSLLGFKTLTVEAVNHLNIEMEEKPLELKEVVVKAPQMHSKGDTIVYNASSFVRKTDKNIEDLLKKMPGLTVESNGKIQYKGKPINKFYIEGLDMFWGKYSLATQNIPASDVASVSVYENHQPIKLLKGIELSDKAALNIKLKENKLGKLRGTMQLGTGKSAERLHYLSEIVGLMIGSKKQVLTTLKGSNMGNYYTSQTANLIETQSSTIPKSYNLFSENPFSKPSLPNKRFLFNKSALLSFNGITKNNKDAVFILDGSIGKLNNNYLSSQRSVYFKGLDSVVFEQRVQPDIKKDVVELGCKIEKNSDRTFYTNRFDFSTEKSESYFPLETTNYYEESHLKKKWSITNNLMLKKKINKNIYGLSSYISFSKNPESLVNILAEGKAILQKGDGYSLATRHSTSFRWGISSYSNIGLKLNLETFQDKVDFYQENNAKTTAKTTEQVKGNELTSEAELFYNYGKDKWSFSLKFPVKFHFMSFENEKLPQIFEYHKPKINFSAYSSYKFTPLFSANINISRRQILGNIMDFFTFPVYVNYQTISAGGAGILSQKDIWQGNFSIDYTNTMEGIFFSGSIGMFSIKRNLAQTSTITEIINTEKGEKKNTHDIKTGNFFFSKNFRDAGLVFSLNASGNLLKREFFRQKISYDAKIASFSLKPSIRYSFTDKAYIETDLTYNISKTELMLRNETFNNYDCTLRAYYLIMDNVELHTNINYYNQEFKNKQYKETVFSDFGLRYLSGKFEIELNCTNLFNEKTYYYSLYNNIDKMSYEYKLQPRRFDLSIKFKY